MALTRSDAVQFLLRIPYKLGHQLGFTDLREFHNEWLTDMILGEGDETLQAHRGSYKTTCVSIALAEIMLLFPDDKVMFMRKTDSDVKEVIMQVKNILLSNVFQQLSKVIYGNSLFLPMSSATAINTSLSRGVKGTPQLIGIGTGSSLTGKHFDRIFTDDIVNVNDRISKAERERTKIVYQELQNIKNRGGRLFNTGTPWHKDDCFTLMPNPQKWDYKATGLISEDEALNIRDHMTASLFAANYELRHIAEDDIIFENPVTGGDASMVEQGISHVDAAYWGSDTTAFTIVKKHSDKYYVFGKMWERHVDHCMDQIQMYHEKFNCGKLYNELNADKGYLAKQFRMRGIRVTSYTENENKYVKITSWLKFEWKNIIFVEGTDEKYIQQITDFTENAEHDDCADSLASLIRVLSRKRSDDYTPLWN